MPDISIVMLSWKRPENIPVLLESIKYQSASTEIFLWNNDKNNNQQYDVDLQINSSANLMCWTRWLLTVYASSDFVCVIDDDLAFADSEVLSDCIAFCLKHDCAIGGFGVRLNNRHYMRGRHIHITDNRRKPSDDVEVDILKGRFIVTPIDFVRNIKVMEMDATVNNPRIEDDIIISSYIEKKIVPVMLDGRLKELPADNSLMSEPEHFDSRERYRRKYFDK